MAVKFGMVNAGKRPLENGSYPLFYVSRGEEGGFLFMATDLRTFFETKAGEKFRVCLEDEFTHAIFLRDKLPLMRAVAEKANGSIDEESLRRFLSLGRDVTPGSEEPALPVRSRERVRTAAPAPVTRERVRTPITAFPPTVSRIAQPGPNLSQVPKTRERTRGVVITAQTNVTVEEMDLVPTTPRVRTRTRG